MLNSRLTSPTNPVGWTLLTLRNRIDRARQMPERGASAIEWVIITAIAVGLVALIGTVIWQFVEDQSNKIEDTELPGT